MPRESSIALALSLSPRAINLSMASVCVDDDGASNASKAKAPAPTALNVYVASRHDTPHGMPPSVYEHYDKPPNGRPPRYTVPHASVTFPNPHFKGCVPVSQ